MDRMGKHWIFSSIIARRLIEGRRSSIWQRRGNASSKIPRVCRLGDRDIYTIQTLPLTARTGSGESLIMWGALGGELLLANCYNAEVRNTP
jgi:hypothetical protein